jgi:NAD(P)-dependent dehydrogenase (short-subunit alcohol dehydrogenase family)
VTASRIEELFDLTGRVAVVTGGAGLLGQHHLSILQAAGATVVGIDIVEGSSFPSVKVDIADAVGVSRATTEIVERFGPIDILVNNAARNPAVEASGAAAFGRFESFSVATWDAEIAIGLTGAFLVSQAIGPQMAARGKGVILNVCSDLAVIAPDQRLYRQPGLDDADQPAKPVSYSVVKHGLLGLTRYLATYWASHGVRVNALSPGGVENGQDPEFLRRVSDLIPLGRMAGVDEYEGAILFCCSDASSYMTGHNLIVDGGRTSW